MRTRHLASVLCAVLTAAGVGAALAKDEPATLRWRRTYGEALLEARLRNVPVLITRQKDG
jgi:hypothetical protein